MGSLGRNANAASGSTGSLTGSIISGILQANLLGQALNAAGNAAQFMMGKFEEAKKIQLDTVSAAGTFAALTGESYKESEKFVISFGAELSKIAGALPGATADYQKVANSIMDNVIPAFKDANGVLNKGEFKQNLTDITKQMTLLGISSGTDATAVGMFTARLLDGNVASAKQLLFADNNPAFINLLEQEMKKRGKVLNDMKNLSSKERIDVVKAVSGKLITKDVIDAASNTVEGLLAGIQSTIFDPTSGVFGLLRDLNTAEGQQNIMTAVASGIKAVMDFFDAGAKLLSALGVPSVDPMLVLYNGINTITGWVKQAGAIVGSMASVAKAGGSGLKGLEAIATKYLNPEFLIQKISPLLARISGFVTPIFQKFLNPESIFKSLSGLAVGGLKILAPLAQKFLNPQTLLKNFQLLLDGASNWLNKLFAGLATSTGQLLNAGGGSTGFAAMGAAVGWFVGELIGKVTNFIINLPWGNILITIGNLALAIIPAVVGAIAGFAAKLSLVIFDAIRSIGLSILGGLRNLWDAALFTIQENLGSISQLIQSFFSGLMFGGIQAAIASQQTSIIAAAINSITGLGGLFNSMWQAIVDAFKSAIELAVNAIKTNISNTVGALTNPLGAAQSVVSSATQSRPSGALMLNLGAPKAQPLDNPVLAPIKNNISNTVGALTNPLGAAQSVVKNALPTLQGASDFIFGKRSPATTSFPSTPANTGNILNPGVVQKLEQANAPKQPGAGASSNNYAPTFHVYGVTDPQKLAQAALDHLDVIFASQQAATLAP